MGDHRLNVKISLVGADGIERKIDWWVNWHRDKPSRLFDAMVLLAEESQLPVDSLYEETDFR